MEQVNLNFKCRILKVDSDGFLAEIENNYLIRYTDKVLKYLFLPNDNLEFSLKNVETFSKDEIRQGYAIVYVKLHSFISNGFLFISPEKKHGFFWDSRGRLTHKIFERDNFFLENSIIKIVMKKI